MAGDQASIEDMVSELQELMHQKYATGVSAKLEADPKAAVPGTDIVVRAVIFADPQHLAELKPVLRCAEVADFGDIVFVARQSREGFKEYATKFPTNELQVNHTYHLTLHPLPGADPIAACAVHLFKRDIVAAAKRQMREIIAGPPSRKAKPARRRRR